MRMSIVDTLYVIVEHGLYVSSRLDWKERIMEEKDFLFDFSLFVCFS